METPPAEEESDNAEATAPWSAEEAPLYADETAPDGDADDEGISGSRDSQGRTSDGGGTEDGSSTRQFGEREIEIEKGHGYIYKIYMKIEESR